MSGASPEEVQAGPPVRCWCGLRAVARVAQGPGRQYLGCGKEEAREWCTVPRNGGTFLGWVDQPSSWARASCLRQIGKDLDAPEEVIPLPNGALGGKAQGSGAKAPSVPEGAPPGPSPPEGLFGEGAGLPPEPHPNEGGESIFNQILGVNTVPGRPPTWGIHVSEEARMMVAEWRNKHPQVGARFTGPLLDGGGGDKAPGEGLIGLPGPSAGPGGARREEGDRRVEESPP